MILENLIASAAGNGVIILWDLNKVNESKQGNFVFEFKLVKVLKNGPNKICPK